MAQNPYTSRLLNEAISALSSLPGIGKRTAFRLVLHLLNQPVEQTEELANALMNFRSKIRKCRICHHISEGDLCAVCNNPARDGSIICVVENIRDLLSIETTGTYRGVYHVLGGVISPINDIGPDQLHVNSLLRRVQQGNVREVILALSTTIEGDTTMQYLHRKIKPFVSRISLISRGVAFGGELEYADEMTIAQAIRFRRPWEEFIEVDVGREDRD